MAGMISEDYAAIRREAIDQDRAMAYPEHGNPGTQQPSNVGPQGKHALPEDRPLLPERA